MNGGSPTWPARWACRKPPSTVGYREAGWSAARAGGEGGQGGPTRRRQSGCESCTIGRTATILARNGCTEIKPARQTKRRIMAENDERTVYGGSRWRSATDSASEEKATHDPHPTAAVFDLPVVFSEPSPDLLGDVPARVVPDEHHHFLARRLELFGAPRKEPRRYTAHGPAVDEPQPHLAADLGQVEPVAGDRFGIGSSLATDCWIIRWGFPPSEKLLRAGKATLLHQHSSSKPMAHSGFPSATSINRSLAKLAFFSFVEGVGGGDPSLGPLPAYPEHPRKSRPDGLPRDPPLGEPLLEGNLRRHRERPQAPPAAELPRRAVEQPPQGFGALLVEGVPCSLRPRGFGRQSGKATLVEVVDGIARRLASRTPKSGLSAGRARPSRWQG